MLRNIAAQVMKLAVSKKGNPMKKMLDQASLDVKGSQQRVLKDILHWAKDTQYGIEHDFKSISNSKDFSNAVPVNTYENLRPYVLRHEAGEENILFPGKPMFYATTSGTTAEPKRIPITRKYHDECYNGLTNLWLYNMFCQVPGFMNGYDISMVGKAIEGYTTDKTSYGSFSGHMNAYMPEFIKKFRVVPFEIHDIDDYPSKYYALMRVALAYPIAWIVAANPSSLLELHRFAITHMDSFVKDIFDGTLKIDLNIEGSIRKKIETRLKPQPKRARELEKLQKIHKEHLLPKHYWPTLKVINTWKSGNAALYLEQTKNFYPETTIIREFGYLATEARAGIVLANDQETSIMAAHLLYFEFIEKSELQNEHPTFLGAHELETGKEYGLFITTPSGLYRYNMNDILRVEGFYNSFPMMRFVQKGSGVTSLTGEKLYESQYLLAIKRSLKEVNLKLTFHLAIASLEDSAYHLFIEPAQKEVVDDDLFEKLKKIIDIQLQKINPEYAAKRQSNRLKDLLLHQLQPGAFAKYKISMLNQGTREGQFKMIHLQQDDDKLKLFQSFCKK